MDLSDIPLNLSHVVGRHGGPRDGREGGGGGGHEQTGGGDHYSMTSIRKWPFDGATIDTGACLFTATASGCSPVFLHVLSAGVPEWPGASAGLPGPPRDSGSDVRLPLLLLQRVAV